MERAIRVPKWNGLKNTAKSPIRAEEGNKLAAESRHRIEL